MSHAPAALPGLRILLVHDAPRDQDGVVRHAQQLRAELNRAGHQAQILSFFPLATGDRLSDREWSEHCDALRGRLDTQIAQFDPHLIHVEHSCLLAHVALEAGVPYCMSVTLDELYDAPHDPRWQEIIDDALDNAGRIIVPTAIAQRTAAAQFADVDSDRWVVVDGESSGTLAMIFVPLYRAVLIDRFGEPIRP